MDGSPVLPLGLRGRVHGRHPARGGPGHHGGRCAVKAPVSSITAPSSSSQVVADLRGIAACQLSCPSTLQAAKSPSLQVKACEVEGVSLLCDMSTVQLRPLVPEADRPMVFNAIHGVAHPGIRANRRMMAARFLWPGIQSDIAIWCRNCVACQWAKVTRQPWAPVQPSPSPREGSATCTWTSWVRCRSLLMATCTC